MERRLFADGGYYLDNGVAVCPSCHLDAERTLVSPDELRRMAGIRTVLLPEHLEADQTYDKWGNPVLPGGGRLKGELFHDEAVQKVLAETGVLDAFLARVKAPRTYHLPWSEGRTSDDKVLETLTPFVGKRVIVTEKMDGENTSLYGDGYLHARSIDGRHHSSRDWIKRWWAARAHDLPEDWRMTGENLYARHSIAYEGLPTYFFGFGLWNEKNVCLPWDEMVEWFGLLDVRPVPILYDGIFDEAVIRALPEGRDGKTEGYVVRAADALSYGQFRTHVGKFVRANHVQTNKHWMEGPVMPNGLAGGAGC